MGRALHVECTSAEILLLRQVFGFVARLDPEGGRIRAWHMKKRTGKAKKKPVPKKDRAWFERKVAELKAELEKLPTRRQEQLAMDLETGKENRAMATYKRGDVWWFKFSWKGEPIRESTMLCAHSVID
jgi:hypothetical protein